MKKEGKEEKKVEKIGKIFQQTFLMKKKNEK